MHKLKTITFTQLKDEQLKYFPKISSKIIKNSRDYINYNYCLLDRFYDACKSGEIFEVKKLVKKGVSITSDHDYALVQASKNGHLDIVKYLIKKGANVETNNHEAYRAAVAYNRADVITYLKLCGVNNKENEIQYTKNTHPVILMFTITIVLMLIMDLNNIILFFVI